MIRRPCLLLEQEHIMETETLDIPVLWPNYFEDCEQCVERLKQALAGLDGMHSVTLNGDGRTLLVSYDKDLLTFETIKDSARQLGVTVADRFKHQILPIAGLDCPDCAMKVETAIRRINGVAWASLNYATSNLIAEFEPQITNPAAIRRRIEEFGYSIEEEAPTPRARKIRAQRSMRTILTAVSGLLLAAGILITLALGKRTPASDTIFMISAVTGGIFAARSGFYSLRSLSLDTNFLMTAASVGALCLGEFSEAAAVMFLFSLGSTLEAYTVDKTRKSIKSLIEAFPSRAWVMKDGRVTQVPLEEVQVGETVLIKPGESIPVDATVVTGDSAVNEAPITGESVPRDKTKGDRVYAGSVNGKGSLEVRTTSTAEDNTLARIVHMVEEAQAQKAPSQRFSETFGRCYTPCVIALAILVGVFGPVIFGGPVREWIVRALTLLVVSCPCALVISTPVAIVAAIGNAAKSGILIKGGANLEMLGGVSIVAFDKTGTLTTGKPTVTEVIPFNSHAEREIMTVAAAIECRSEHPLADAIIAKAREMEVPEPPVSFFEALPGKGARAVVNGNIFYIGNRRLLKELSIDVPGMTSIAEMLVKGGTVIYLADESALWGAIGATDTIKATSAPAIAALKNAGIKKTVMLTGDTAQTGRIVAKQIGLDEEHSELLPEDKLARIREMAANGDKVAMVGDGINDAPALAAANVGIAMGGAGSQAAIEAADVALMADDMVMLPYTISLSRRAKRIIRQNVALSLIVVLILVGGALVRWVSLATGVLGHEGSALLVIANSMRLLKRQR